MRPPSLLVAAALVSPFAAAPGPVSAQEDATAYVYASYYECSPGSISGAVQNIRDNWTPIVQESMDGGAVAAWGALTHATGNTWSVGLYHVGPDLDRLRGALDDGIERLYSENPDAAAAFGEACPTHEDYVWTTLVASQPPSQVAAERGTAVMSVYWVCDEGREAVADLIFEEKMAPLWNEQVEAGLVTSWSWLEHYLGGEYRRLLAVDGPDHASLLEARTNVIEAFGENPGLGAAFSEVCNGHQDNLFDIAISRP